MRIPLAFYVGDLMNAQLHLSAISVIVVATIIGHLSILAFLLLDQHRPPKPKLDGFAPDDPKPPSGAAGGSGAAHKGAGALEG